jgi:protein SMG9
MRCVTAGGKSDAPAGGKKVGAGPAEAGPSWKSTKLLSSQLDLAMDELRAMLNDSSDFTVVGVLGRQGVGKSTIMSLLACWESGSPPAAEACRAAASSSDAPSGPPFAAQSLEARLRAEHATCGVDVVVTPERMILLDTCGGPISTPPLHIAPPHIAHAPCAAPHSHLSSLRLAALRPQAD